jgi:hypothetical protein
MKIKTLPLAIAFFLWGSAVNATDLVLYSGNTTISTPVTADNSFWVGVDSPSVSATITNSGSVTISQPNNSTAVGVNSSSSLNTLTVNGSLLSVYPLYVGYSGSSNTMNVAGSVTSSQLYVGSMLGSSSNLLSLVGGNLSLTQDAVVGAEVGADNNRVTVSGVTGSISFPSKTIYIGRSGNGNYLEIVSGGDVIGANGRIGGGSGATGNPSNNSILVDGSGSTLALTGTLRVGAGSSAITDSNSSLELTKGGVVTVSGDSFIGYSSTSSNNHILVDGSGSTINLQDLVIGGSSIISTSTGNYVMISNYGSLISATTIYIPATNSLYVSSDGSLTARDLLSSGTLDIGESTSSIINRDYIQSGGVFRAHALDGTHHTRLAVDGNVSISSDTQVDVLFSDCNQFSPGDIIAGIIVSSQYPISYTPNAITDNCPDLRFDATLSNDSKSLDLISRADPPPPAPIPTLSEWGQIVMMLTMMIAAGWYSRRIMR